MLMIRVHFILLFCVLFAHKGFGQLYSPDFLCIKKDTLFWQPPNNSTSCLFLGYEIWAANSKSGPFTLLSTVTSFSQRFYVHQNSSLQNWFYFLKSNYDCTGVPIITSDTLNNDLKTPDLKSVSIENEKVTLTWSKSESGQTAGYIIYRTTDLGNVPIDTIYGKNTTQYIDTTASPLSKTEYYYVIALDKCGNNSPFTKFQQSIYLKSKAKICQRHIDLSWNPYLNWPGGVSKQVVYVNQGYGWVAADTLSGTDTTYTFKEVKNGLNYFQIKAISDAAFGAEAKSNIVIFNGEKSVINRIQLYNISVVSPNNMQLQWEWDSRSDLKKYEVWRGTSPIQFSKVFESNLTPPFSRYNEFIDTKVQSDSNQYYYKIISIDQCDSTIESNLGGSLFLKGNELSDMSNYLKWNMLIIVGSSTKTYRVSRLTDRKFALANLEPFDLEYTHSIDAFDTAMTNICYLVEAENTYTSLFSGEQTVIVRSNVFCIKRPPVIWIPTAFSPRGVNQEFKPMLLYSNGIQYEMIIFDRWGKSVFETTNYEEGWNGKVNGQDQPEALYHYIIRIYPKNGAPIEEKGNVYLLR